MSSLSIITSEQTILNSLIDTPENIIRFDRNYFISQIGADLFHAMKEAYLKDFSLSIENILIFGNKINQGITRDLLENLKKVEYDKNQFDSYYKQLKKEYAKNQIENKLLKDTLVEVSKKGELNIEKLEELKNAITDNIDLIEGKESLLLSPDTLFSGYQILLHERAKGVKKYPSGDSYLDSFLPAGMFPGAMTTIYGGTGEGKSVFALNLNSKQINKRIPSLVCSLENDKDMTMDRLASLRLKIPFDYFNKNDGNGLEDFIFEKLEEERKLLANNNTFLFVDSSSLSLRDIELLVKEAKRKMKVDYLICTLDLLTMVEEFSKEISASNIEESINELHRIARRQTCHFINVVQANNANDYRPKEIEDINKCRPNIRNIMNSKAIGDRSRIVISIFRPKVYAERFFGDEHPKVITMDDMLHARIEKNNQGKPNVDLKYLFEPSIFKLYRYIEEKEHE